MQVESTAAYVTAIGGHLRLVADSGPATTTTFIDYTDALTAYLRPPATWIPGLDTGTRAIPSAPASEEHAGA